MCVCLGRSHAGADVERPCMTGVESTWTESLNLWLTDSDRPWRRTRPMMAPGTSRLRCRWVSAMIVRNFRALGLSMNDPCFPVCSGVPRCQTVDRKHE
jgi:hypothetical protein